MGVANKLCMKSTLALTTAIMDRLPSQDTRRCLDSRVPLFFYHSKMLLVTLMYPAKIYSVNVNLFILQGHIIIEYLQKSKPSDYIAILTRFTTSNYTNRLIGVGGVVI